MKTSAAHCTRNSFWFFYSLSFSDHGMFCQAACEQGVWICKKCIIAGGYGELLFDDWDHNWADKKDCVEWTCCCIKFYTLDSRHIMPSLSKVLPEEAHCSTVGCFCITKLCLCRYGWDLHLRCFLKKFLKVSIIPSSITVQYQLLRSSGLLTPYKEILQLSYCIQTVLVKMPFLRFENLSLYDKMICFM